MSIGIVTGHLVLSVLNVVRGDWLTSSHGSVVRLLAAQARALFPATASFSLSVAPQLAPA